jgi:hypothetical protein
MKSACVLEFKDLGRVCAKEHTWLDLDKCVEGETGQSNNQSKHTMKLVFMLCNGILNVISFKPHNN